MESNKENVKAEENQDTVNQINNGKTEEEVNGEVEEKPFWQRIIEIGAEIPIEEWEKLPRDFSKNAEHYMYGAPKEE
ncbi:MAG: hypothetical protein ACRDEA_07435 [Microcystaceae cyanobacterium]